MEKKKKTVFGETIMMMKRKYNTNNKSSSSSDLNSTEQVEDEYQLRPTETSQLSKSINPRFDSSTSRVSHPPPDARRVKRVRFAEPDTLRPLTSEDPKTSEYAFCKKLRKDAGHSFRSYELHKHKQFERNEESTCAKELAKMVKPDDEIRSFSPIEKGTNFTLVAPFSPIMNSGEDPKTSEYAFYKKLREDAGHDFHSYHRRREHRQLERPEAELTKVAKPNYEIRYLSPTERGTPVTLVSPYSRGASVNSGPECERTDIFSIKRQKVLHLAAEALSLDNDKLCSEGYDLVSMLLQRLVPAETSCSRFGSRSRDTKFNSQLRVTHEADIHFEKVPRIPSITSVSPFAAKKSNNSLLDSWSNESREWNLSQEVGGDSGSLLMWHPKKAFPEYEKRQPGDFVDSGVTLSLHPKKDSGFNAPLSEEFSFDGDGYLTLDYLQNQSRLLCPPYKMLSFDCESPNKSFGPSGRTSFKQLDDLCCPYKLSFDSTQHTQYLGWGTNSIEKEQDVLNSWCGAVSNVCPTWGSPSEDNIFDTSGMRSPPLREINHCTDIILKNMSSESYVIDAVGRESPEEREYQVEDFPLTLCCTPKFLGVEKRCTFSSIVHDISIFHSPLSKSTILGEKLTPRFGMYLQSSQNFDYRCDGIDDFTHSDLQLDRKDTRGTSAFLLARDTTTERYMESLSNTAEKIQLAEDSYGASDITSLTWKNEEELYPLILVGSSRNESGEISYDGNGDMLDSF